MAAVEAKVDVSSGCDRRSKLEWRLGTVKLRPLRLACRFSQEALASVPACEVCSLKSNLLAAKSSTLERNASRCMDAPASVCSAACL